jgi:lipopolysaccharide biosynthesis protein
MNFRQQLLSNLGRGPAFEEHTQAAFPIGDSPVRLIAFYLPQYHPIPQNDLWWGKGFTEWTNVTKAIPRFVGHYQPHLPGELGFYDLRLPDTLRRQAELARHYGVAGFCFHYYWFGGRRILETPLNNLLAHPDIDLPFCINWANENWTRTWDGGEKNVLLEQAHSDEDDIAFARSLEPLVRDPRYIRIRGRPLIMLYRPALLPDATATLRRWRAHFSASGLGDPFLVMAQSFGDNDPRPYGFDAAAEFAPHKVGLFLPHKVGFGAPNQVSLALRFARDYEGNLLSYDHMARTAMQIGETDFTLFRGVCPSWDSEARRPNRGTSFVNSTPRKYGEWLAWACRRVLQTNAAEERIVFINAWNEWAEGTHLEPDRHFGYAYLKATAHALATLNSPTPAKKSSVIGTGEIRVPSAHRLRYAYHEILSALKRPGRVERFGRFCKRMLESI